MSINRDTETLITPKQARALVPEVNGKRPDLSTIQRWMDRGVLAADRVRVKLESINLPCARCTSVEALKRFFDRLDNGPQPPRPTPEQIAATPAHQETMRRLAAHGI